MTHKQLHDLNVSVELLYLVQQGNTIRGLAASRNIAAMTVSKIVKRARCNPQVLKAVALKLDNKRIKDYEDIF